MKSDDTMEFEYMSMNTQNIRELLFYLGQKFLWQEVVKVKV